MDDLGVGIKWSNVVDNEWLIWDLVLNDQMLHEWLM